MWRWAMVGAALGLAACGKADAPPTPLEQASAAARAASTQFLAMAPTGGVPPRATDPKAGPLLDTILNTAALPTTPVSGKDMDALNDWLNSVNQVGITYILAGTGASSLAAANTPAADQQAGANVVTYAPEIGRYFDAEMAIMGLESSSMAQMLAADPGQTSNAQVADGLAKMRGGFAQATGGVINTIIGPGLSDDWREARGKALVAVAPNIAKLLLPADRRALQQLATQAEGQTTDGRLMADLTEFAAMIAPAGT